MTTLRISDLARRAFTLVELLAAVSVLVILVLVLAQAVGMVSEIWRAGKARVDNFAQARVALGLIARDIESMVLRRDVAAFVNATGDASACAFYTRMPGVEGDRKVSLVEYRLEDPDGAPKLVRGDYGLNYETQPDPRTLNLESASSLPLDDVQAQDIAEGVIRFEWIFIARDGSPQEMFDFDYETPDAPGNTRAIRLSLAVLDADAYRLARETGALALVLSRLGGDPAANQTHAAYWSQVRDSAAFVSGLPRPVVRSLRIFERTVSIPLQR